MSRQITLIPREILFGNPDHITLQTSPDGKHLTYLAPRDGVLNVWCAPDSDLKKASPLTHDKKRGIQNYLWAYTNKHILYVQDTNGDENWQVYCVNLDSRETLNLTPEAGVQARLTGVSPDFPEEVLISLNNRSPEFHDIYKINILTGERVLVRENNGYVGFISDDDFKLPFGLKMAPEGGTELYKLKSDGSGTLFIKIGFEDYITTTPLGLNKDKTKLYMADSRDRNTAALVEIDVETGKATLLCEDTRADFCDVLIHPTLKKIQAFASNYDRKKWQILDESIAEDLAYLKDLDPGDAEITSRSHDDRIWTIAYIQDDGAPRYYRYDRSKKEGTYLFSAREHLDEYPLVKMKPVIIPARDGESLVSYLTLPLEKSTNLPLVLVVHGGPWARDSWGYNPLHQWLANRGYAVLSVNYRASTGFGKDFINKSHGQWSRAMHDDLIDAVQWTVQEGIADPKRVAIMGGSYGGYAALVGLTFTPDQFACAIDIVGPSNLETLILSIPSYWKPLYSSMVKKIGGDPATEEGRAFLKEISPLTYVDRIQKPLLIAQGANDPRVKQGESDQIALAMSAKNIPVTYALFSDEGHGFARPENRLAFYAVTEAFLAKHLGGRVEPVGGAFTNSTIEFKFGPDFDLDMEAA